MQTIKTVRDVRLEKVRADRAAEARDAKRRGMTIAEACKIAASLSPHYAVLCKNGKPAFYDSRSLKPLFLTFDRNGDRILVTVPGATL